jgi:uncharacterized membrane protein
MSRYCGAHRGPCCHAGGKGRFGGEANVMRLPSGSRICASMQVPLAVSATVSGALRGIQGGGAVWFWAAALVFAVIPFTLIVIFPTNHRLLDPRRDKRSAETRQLLERWGRLHAVRTVLGLCASILFVWAATRMQG